MVDWSASMQQTFEYYVVDPGTWKDIKRLDNVKSCTINRDSTVETLGSATIEVTESIGECYIRVYLITIQNGIREKHPLGTFLAQTPSSSFNGKLRNVSMDAYTSLLELKEKQPTLGYYIPKDSNIMDIAYRLVRENARAPVVATSSSGEEVSAVCSFDFIADANDTWLSFLSDFIANQTYEREGLQPTIRQYRFDIDEMGRILFAPVQDIASLQPVKTFDDSNSSILYPELTMDHDLYGIPNVVEVVYSSGNDNFYAYAENTNPNSPVSIQKRGRRIAYRVTDPNLVGHPTQAYLDEYAKQILKTMSSPEYTVTYTHAYCPVRLSDCVRLNYSRAGLTDIKAKVISQTIKCVPGCPVTEKAVFTTNLWG